MSNLVFSPKYLIYQPWLSIPKDEFGETVSGKSPACVYNLNIEIQ